MLELGPDDESPAVVNLLVHGGRLSAEALPATVLDLAGRRHLTLDEISPGEYLCRLSHRSGPDDPLTPYEEQVWTLLRDRAEGGTVPADALTFGAGDESPDWWRAFQKAVVGAAKERGLTGYGGARSLLLVGGATLAVAGLFAALGTTNQTVVGFAFLLAVALGGFLTIDNGSIGRITLNRHGRTLARRWTDAGADLGASGGFQDVPPSGTAIWGRELGYAAALGLAPAACRGLPLGPERARRAWVRRGGLWVLARVRYPRHLPPGWGRRPAVAALRGVVGAASAAAVVVFAAVSGPWDPEPPFAHDVARRLGAAKPVVATLAVVVFVLSIWELGAAVADLLGEPRRVTGVIVGRWVRQGGRWNPWGDLVPRRSYVAVDDGSSREVRGWWVAPGVFAAVRDRDVVEARVTPRLARVIELHRVRDVRSSPLAARSPRRRGGKRGESRQTGSR